jgi:small-conductance mechanosensitive channel
MSSALRNLLVLPRRTLPALTTTRRTFVTSSVRYAGKESKLGTEGRAEEAEQLKQEHLRKQKEGKGEWTDGLASDSESIIKADRGELDASAETINKLQKETEEINKRHNK